ncbi:transcriptional regulator, AraC family [Litoreibacter ascidiaceicola]|uniref:Transcriptional regulator, AraC family n=1 Tax=Litoreibacter ascidiaceicola TaxID=1486859 RepID=A0A1M4ZTP3_9RHOB|nr:helix-turn-helix domain-containing protein [Litoreibacter ascidiaceicola]SHF21440.1 transcriptional regulator, AraC family [Litoreibacter ascidiaceicola]
MGGHLPTDPAPNAAGTSMRRMFELYVTAGFSELELSAITHTLAQANDMLAEHWFSWRYVSDAPGLVKGASGMMVRAEPAIMNYGFSDVMIVVGGRQDDKPAWLARARAMQRQARLVVLLSDAATVYIKSTSQPAGGVTTHWRDIAALEESGYHPNLTTRFSENSDGIITAAGVGATAELVIGLIASQLQAPHVAELGNRLLLHTIRKSNAEQPKDIADNEGLFDIHVTQAIRLMEDTIAEPMSMAELTAQVGLSTRHLERVFRKVFNDSPARFYKKLRAKRARTMIEETLMPMVDIAVATGFGSVNTLSKAVKDEYGMTPSKMRARRKISLLAFDEDQSAR